MSAARLFNRRTVVALAAAVALLFAGTAFTASVTTTGVTETAGYGTVSVSGGTLSSMALTTNTAGDKITDAKLAFAEVMTGKTVTINFDGATPKSCSIDTLDTTNKTVICSSLNQDTNTANTVGISVTA